MSFFALFSITNLLIWVPGLLLLLAVLMSLRADQPGTEGKAVWLHPLVFVLLGVCLLLAILVPRHEINKTLEFARAFNNDPSISSLADMDYATKEAYFRSFEREEGAAIAGGANDDLFDFGASPGETAADQAPAPAFSEIEYKLERTLAWFILVVFLIMGGALFIQSPGMLGMLTRSGK